MRVLPFAIVGLAVLAVGHLTACGREPITAARLAAETNKRVALPLDLGDGMRLDSITAEGNAVVSTVTMTDDEVAYDPRFQEIMRTATVSDICREIAPAKQLYTDAALTVTKVYKDSKGADILRVEVRPAECG